VSEPDTSTEAAARLSGQASGHGQVYQVGSGNLHVENSHYHGPLRSAAVAKLIADRPPGWEYMLHGHVLSEGMEALQGKWLSYNFGHTMRASRYQDEKAALDYLGQSSREAGRIISSLTNWFNPELEERAFGRMGEPGNAAAIEYFVRSLCALLDEFLDLAIELRSVGLPPRLTRVRELTLKMFDEPIQDTYHFFEKLIAQFEAVPKLLATRTDAPIVIELEFVLKVDPAVSAEIDREFGRLRKSK
jgi:hypothetical protein